MTDKLLPFIRPEDIQPHSAGEPLVMVAAVGGSPAPLPGMTMTEMEAVKFRKLGEAAEAADDQAAALAHYTRAVDLWWMVGCRRRRDQLRKLLQP